jgi:hypothetical protein
MGAVNERSWIEQPQLRFQGALDGTVLAQLIRLDDHIPAATGALSSRTVRNQLLQL